MRFHGDSLRPLLGEWTELVIAGQSPKPPVLIEESGTTVLLYCPTARFLRQQRWVASGAATCGSGWTDRPSPGGRSDETTMPSCAILLCEAVVNCASDFIPEGCQLLAPDRAAHPG
jgi:hypothetical protein